MMKLLIDLDNYAHSEADAWRWRGANGNDVQAIVDLAQDYFGPETAGIFQNDPIEYSRNVMLATVNQFYNPRAELLSVAYNQQTNQLMGYTWAMRGQRAPWSTEEMVAIRVAHVAMNLSARQRVYLCAQMLRMWERWADACDIQIICSSTIRQDQPGFLRLHRDAGYDVRGSIAYKRLNKIALDADSFSAGTLNTTSTRVI